MNEAVIRETLDEEGFSRIMAAFYRRVREGDFRHPSTRSRTGRARNGGCWAISRFDSAA